MKKRILGLVLGCVLCFGVPAAFAAPAIDRNPQLASNYTELSGLLVWDGYSFRPAEAILAEEEAMRKFIESQPPVVFEKKSGYYLEGEREVFEAWFKNGKYLGTFTDEDDTLFMLATLKKEPLPPRVSEGWVSLGLLFDSRYDIVYDGDSIVVKTSPTFTKQEELLRLSIPKGWKDQKSGDAIVDDLRLKKYNSVTYFNVEDLIKTGILQ
ncbi:hypothetical protein [Desulforamulus ruminis]|uniref:hypothetical protein n=1 Tax=Desulforamulus ruminis TaxID=1564 RepID=UPI002355D3B1|nr:hypothetical protein [Desulforamulus ruminis]